MYLQHLNKWLHCIWLCWHDSYCVHLNGAQVACEVAFMMLNLYQLIIKQQQVVKMLW